MTSITVADSVVTLAVAGLFLTPQRLQGYAADDVFTVEQLQPIESMMGVDGLLSAGYVPVPVNWSITLQADSPSNVFFDTWYTAAFAARGTFPATGTVVLPGLGRKWAMIKGFLKGYKIMPDAGKVLKPRKYDIVWESVSPAPV